MANTFLEKLHPGFSQTIEIEGKPLVQEKSQFQDIKIFDSKRNGRVLVLDDILEIVPAVGHKLDVIMLPKVEGPWDIHYLDQLLAQLEARHSVTRPILIHAILETAEGVKNVEAIAGASPRMQGISLGPADLAASRKMKTTRVGGGHPGYRVIEDPDPDDLEAPRASAQQDLWHYSIGRMVDACTSGSEPGPSSDDWRLPLSPPAQASIPAANGAGPPARRQSRAPPIQGTSIHIRSPA